MKHLFAFYYLLDIIQLIQCFKRGQIIDIQIQNLIPYLPNTGSSNWKKLSCIPLRPDAISAVGLAMPCWRLSVSS